MFINEYSLNNNNEEEVQNNRYGQLDLEKKNTRQNRGFS